MYDEIMARVKLIRIKPENFFKKIQNQTNFTYQELADVCKVDSRSFSDWKTGRYLMPLFVFRKLIKIGGFNSPMIKILPDYWHIQDAGRKGAITRNKIYGSPGTPEGRSKGGKTTCQKLHSNPELARKLGF